jgi:hypothetical protein
LIEREGGVGVLSRGEILESTESPELRQYAAITLKNVMDFKRDGKIDLEQFLDG